MREQHAQLIEGMSITSNETTWMKKDGSRVEVSVSTAPVRDEAGEITALISVSRDITSRNPMVHCEENQLKQVFINLLKNGMEAMPDGGNIRIKLNHDEENSRVRIEIKDEGTGIPEELMPKLGEPFFTSKESGTGLGLMVSQRIIQSHKGMMDIKSVMNKGTTVIIDLPASQQQPESIEEEHKTDNELTDEEN
ncbi:hypothetical protein G195_006858 [Phytophthora kernoviae 00238/432]|uniref:Histidine kinase domain-containing protein n=1 Tax=Phytophthora kernoviae 00238/432 TaxID=1284355 RepID=A0A8J4SCS9_9STRA|nr:hypothetical protein G195_006858 [Phytophthora kernoviae 00238/432]